jgi:hypothetical protein
MLIDKLELLSDEQALTATAISTNVYDTLPSGGSINAGDTGGPTANTTTNFGAGKTMYLYSWVHTTLDSSGEAATLDVTLESSADTSNGTPTVHLVIPQIAEATLAAGYWIAKGIPLPPGTYKRYLCVNYTVGTENFTSGKVSSWLSDTPFNENQYRSGSITGIN